MQRGNIFSFFFFASPVLLYQEIALEDQEARNNTRCDENEKIGEERDDDRPSNPRNEEREHKKLSQAS